MFLTAWEGARGAEASRGLSGKSVRLPPRAYLGRESRERLELGRCRECVLIPRGPQGMLLRSHPQSHLHQALPLWGQLPAQPRAPKAEGEQELPRA